MNREVDLPKFVAEVNRLCDKSMGITENIDAQKIGLTFDPSTDFNVGTIKFAETLLHLGTFLDYHADIINPDTLMNALTSVFRDNSLKPGEVATAAADWLEKLPEAAKK